MSKNDPAERTVRDIRRKTRKQYTAEEKIRIVVSGLRGEESIAALCRREGLEGTSELSRLGAEVRVAEAHRTAYDKLRVGVSFGYLIQEIGRGSARWHFHASYFPLGHGPRVRPRDHDWKGLERCQ